MPRTARIIIPNAFYHILNRGNNKEVIFTDDADFIFFLRQVKKYKDKFGLKIYHYCVMPNHCHFLVQTQGTQDLTKFMHAIMFVYAQYMQRKYNKGGHVWQGRYKSSLIEKEDYLLRCGYYIEDNPRRAMLVKELRDWPWSSYHFYAYGKSDRIVDVDEDYTNLGKTLAERQLNYQYRMGELQAGGPEEVSSIRKKLDRGIFGREMFLKEMVEKFQLKLTGTKKLGRPFKNN